MKFCLLVLFLFVCLDLSLIFRRIPHSIGWQNLNFSPFGFLFPFPWVVSQFQGVSHDIQKEVLELCWLPCALHLLRWGSAFLKHVASAEPSSPPTGLFKSNILSLLPSLLLFLRPVSLPHLHRPDQTFTLHPLWEFQVCGYSYEGFCFIQLGRNGKIMLCIFSY